MNKNNKKQREIEALSDKFLEQQGPRKHTGAPFYATFDEYVADYPAGEMYRSWLTAIGKREVCLVAMNAGDRHNSLPGDYLWVVISEHELYDPHKILTATVSLYLHDNDDGLATRRWSAADRQEAYDMLEQMKQLAPFTFAEAVEFFGLSL